MQMKLGGWVECMDQSVLESVLWRNLWTQAKAFVLLGPSQPLFFLLTFLLSVTRLSFVVVLKLYVEYLLFSQLINLSFTFQAYKWSEKSEKWPLQVQNDTFRCLSANWQFKAKETQFKMT